MLFHNKTQSLPKYFELVSTVTTVWSGCMHIVEGKYFDLFLIFSRICRYFLLYKIFKGKK